MTDLYAFLDKWQSLVGALLGGLFALWTALVVANSATRREQRASAYLLLWDLQAVQATEGEILKQVQERKVGSEKRALFVADALLWSKHPLSQSFEASSVRLMDIHVGLAAHLSLLMTIYLGLDDNLERIKTDRELVREMPLKSIPRSLQETEADAVIVEAGLSLAARHAECASHLIEDLLFSNTPTWHRIRRSLFPSAEHKKSDDLLSKGHV